MTVACPPFTVFPPLSCPGDRTVVSGILTGTVVSSYGYMVSSFKNFVSVSSSSGLMLKHCHQVMADARWEFVMLGQLKASCDTGQG